MLTQLVTDFILTLAAASALASAPASASAPVTALYTEW